MNMALICMGRLKEKYWRDAANEYEKRLSRFGKFEEIELPDLPEPTREAEISYAGFSLQTKKH